jgi:hypothetical protein
MIFVNETIRNSVRESDIKEPSSAYEEIAAELTALGLNLAFFVFTNRGHSSSARSLDGKNLTCPLLTLYLKYDADFRQTGIDSHEGNWNDKWTHTRAIRDALNTILHRHGFDGDYVCKHTFIFVRSLEELAFREIGRNCKAAVRDLVRLEVPGAEVSHVFWNGSRYDVIMREKSDYKRVEHKAKAKLTKSVAKLLAKADKEEYCKTYNASLEFGHAGMNLFHFVSEDLA